MGISYKAVVQPRLTREKMSWRRSRSDAESGSVGSSRRSSWREHRLKRREDRDHEREEEWSDLGEGSYQTQRTVSSASRHRRFDERDEELERLRRLVRDLELEVENRHRKRARDNRERRSDARGDRYGMESNQSGSRQH